MLSLVLIINAQLFASINASISKMYNLKYFIAK